MRAKHLTILAAFIFTRAAFAAHPLVTEDTQTQDVGISQLEINTDHVRQRVLTRTISAVTYTYGAANGLDLFFNAPMMLSSPSGVSDVSFGAKWRFFERDELALALKPELFLPSGNENQALGTGKPGFALNMIGDWISARWMFQMNAAIGLNSYQLSSDRASYRNTLWRASSAVRYFLTEQWQLVSDIGIARNIDVVSSGTPTYFLAGAIYSPVKTLDLDAGLRFGLGCKDCPSQVARQFGVGLTWRF